MTQITRLAVLLIAFALIGAACTTESGDPKPFDKTNACLFAKDAVKEVLLSPGSAKFPDSFCSAVTATNRVNSSGQTVWTVSGPVDAQNGFGALIRHTYTVEITDLGDGNRYRANVLSVVAR